MKKNYTEIICILDKSGSMHHLTHSTIRGFNAFIESQKNLEGVTKVSCILFDDYYQKLFSGRDIHSVRLTGEDYRTGGSTALLDAIGKTIIDTGRRYSGMSEHERPEKVIVMITTDGYENASVEYSYHQVNELINHQEKKYNWEFVFMGANIDVAKESKRLGIKKKNAFRYVASEEGVVNMYKEAACTVAELRHKV